MEKKEEAGEYNYLAEYKEDKKYVACDIYPYPIVFEETNIEKCEIIDYAPGWNGKGCTDPEYAALMQSYFKVHGTGYTRIMYRCPKHGVVKDNLYFGSEEEKTGIFRCYDCISDEIDRVIKCRIARYNRLQDLKKEEEANQRGKGKGGSKNV